MPAAHLYGSAPTLELERYPLDIYRCPECNYHGLYDLIPGLYDTLTERTASIQNHRDYLAEYAFWVKDNYPPKPGHLILDIGSNDGWFLSMFESPRYGTLGVEPTDAAFAAHDRGVATLKAFWDEAAVSAVQQLRMPVSVINVGRVWANVDDLDTFTDNMLAVLAPDGHIIIETGYLPDILEKTLVETIYHEHISYDLALPIAHFMRRKGLNLHHLSHHDVKGGSGVA